MKAFILILIAFVFPTYVLGQQMRQDLVSLKR